MFCYDAKRSMAALARVQLLEADGVTRLEVDAWLGAGDDYDLETLQCLTQSDSVLKVCLNLTHFKSLPQSDSF